MPAEPLFEDLTREIILDHYRRPRNRGELAGPTVHVEGMNPVCGDEILLDLRSDGERLCELAFGGQGCSISQASASMMTDRVAGKSFAEARHALGQVRAMLVDGGPPARDLGDMEALEGVAKFPARVKCALLCWNVLQQGLDQLERKQVN